MKINRIINLIDANDYQSSYLYLVLDLFNLGQKNFMYCLVKYDVLVKNTKKTLSTEFLFFCC